MSAPLLESLPAPDGAPMLCGRLADEMTKDSEGFFEHKPCGNNAIGLLQAELVNAWKARKWRPQFWSGTAVCRKHYDEIIADYDVDD